ncbi:MAG: hypothetical protein ACTS5I_07440 [Rhodanobacter sp.]
MSDVTLREYLESQIQWLDRHVKTQIEQIDENTEKALETLDRRLEGMNEFRASLEDKNNNLVPRTEYSLRMGTLEERLKSVELSRATGEGKTLVLSAVVAIASSVMVVMIASWLVK